MERKKTILLATGLYPPEFGGPATYSKFLEECIARAALGIRVIPFSRVRKYPKIVRHVLYVLLLIKNGWNADIIYALDPVSVGLPAVITARLLRKPFILRIVGDYAWEQGQQRFGVVTSLDDFTPQHEKLIVRILSRVERYVALKARFIIVPSEYLKKILKKWRVTDSRIKVIPNAVNVESSVNQTTKERNDGVHTLITVGRLVPWKGMVELLDAVHELKNEHVEVELLIVGDGPLRATIEKKINDAGMSNYVQLLGTLNKRNLYEKMLESDLFVLNTAYEGFSHAILEAMSLGIPVLTTDVGGNTELISHGENGYLIKSNDKRSLKAAIKLLINDAGLRNKLAQAGKISSKRFSPETVAADTVKQFAAI